MHLCACVCLQKPAAMSRAYGSMARTKLFSLREKLPREALTATNNHRSKIAAIRDHWEQCQFENSEGDMNRADQFKMSAARPLRRTVVVDKDKLPGGTVYAAQRELVKRHYEAKSKIDGISGIGGGISLWPAMDDMRLSGSDTVRLAVFCVVLVVATLAVFYSFHGTHVTKLKHYSSKLESFHSLHPLSINSDQEYFAEQLISWHDNFLQLQDSIHRDFDVIWSECSSIDIAFLVFYPFGIIILLYFLVDNMFSKNRLTPRRIKIWISLLCVVMTWTLLFFYLLMCAQALEAATQNTVHALSNELAGLIKTPLNLSQYHDVLLYWRTRCLPPTTRGTLSIMGILQVQDVAYFLQYYSLPILTALCTPIVKIIISLKAVYKH